MPSSISGEEYVNSRGRADHFGISLRTSDRWENKGILRGPDLVVNGRRYWKHSSLIENAREIAARFAAERTSTSAINPEEEAARP
jgi:hypothetical protein